MDPTANLGELVTMAEEFQDLEDNGHTPEPEDVARMAELVLALDGWLRGGGFLPKQWRKADK